MIVGLISDTHGLLRPDVHTVFSDVDLILHAGDVGGDEILLELSLIAPTLAVFGNTDPPGMSGLLARIDETFEGVRIHVSHGHELGAPRTSFLLATYDADVIVYGHTHRQLVHTAPDGRIVVNPGAAGQRRFDEVPSVARLTILDGKASVEIVPLKD